MIHEGCTNNLCKIKLEDNTHAIQCDFVDHIFMSLQHILSEIYVLISYANYLYIFGEMDELIVSSIWILQKRIFITKKVKTKHWIHPINRL